MQNNNIVFEYSPQSKVCHDDTQAANRFFISSIISMIMSLVFILGYIIFPNVILLCCMLFSIVFFTVSFKHLDGMYNDKIDVLLSATDTTITIKTYDTVHNNIIGENSLNYNDIYKSYFVDKACTSLVIILTDGTCVRYYLRKYSPPQYFFLYCAAEYFTMSKPTANKILKRFGSEKQYKKLMLQLYAGEVNIK